MEQLNAELLSTYQSEPAKGWFRSHITDAVLIQGWVALLGRFNFEVEVLAQRLSPCKNLLYLLYIAPTRTEVCANSLWLLSMLSTYLCPSNILYLY